MRHRICLAGLLAVIAMPIAAPTATAATFTVNGAGDASSTGATNDATCAAAGGGCTLRAAIEEANGTVGADDIAFALPSPATITLGGTQLPVISAAGGTVTIAGPGAQALTLSGDGASRVLEVGPAAVATVSGLTITGGNHAGTDGPLHTAGGDGAGAAAYNAGVLNLTSVVVRDNTTSGGTGGDGDPLGISSTEVTGGPGGVGAGGAIFSSGLLTIEDSALTGNSVVGGTGGTSADGGASTPFQSGDGGLGLGGAIASSGTLTIEDTSFSGNYANGGFGGQGGTAGINTSGGQGGDAGGGLGGAIYNAGQATIDGSTISGNDVFGGLAGGGGDGNGPLPGMIGDPGADLHGIGGGIQHVAPVLPMTLTNSTISGNRANTEPFYPGVGFGGGIATSGTAPLSATHVTLVDNEARTGGTNLGTVNGPVTLRGTIIASLAPEPAANNCTFGATVVTSTGPNVDDGTSCGLPPTDLEGVEPGLGALAGNGGPTRTHLPAATSPVVDAVTAACPPPALDQRELPRTANACDIGSVERQSDDNIPTPGGTQPPPPPPTTPAAGPTGKRAAALKKCKKKKRKARKKCLKKAKKQPL